MRPTPRCSSTIYALGSLYKLIRARARQRHPQLTSDGLKLYIKAVEDAFGADVDYAMLVKMYGSVEGEGNERRCSPPRCLGTVSGAVSGDPDPKHISTSYVERQNLTMRMSMRRFTQLTNAFSRKVQNHACAVALHYMHYNFGRIHKTLRVTPAMQAGIADHIWALEENGLHATILSRRTNLRIRLVIHPN